LSLAAKSNVRLVEGGQDKHRNRTVDILFHSVAAHARGRGIGVVLSGPLDDGSRGAGCYCTRRRSDHGAHQAGGGWPGNAGERRGVCWPY
jgi:hypothetical protein